MNSIIISVSHGEALADLFLQFGEGTEDPSVLLENHNQREQIKLGEIQRFPGMDRKERLSSGATKSTAQRQARTGQPGAANDL